MKSEAPAVAPLQLDYRRPVQSSAQKLNFACVIVLTVFFMLVLTAILPARMGHGNPKPAAARADLSNIADALTAFKSDVGRLPTNAEGLAVLVSGITSIPVQVQYLRRFPKDPWQSDYRYQLHADGVSFTVSSDGRDGISGTHDDIVLDSRVDR